MKHLTLTGALFALLSTCIQANDDPYGLLFTTPDQRARLDNRFNSHITGSDLKTGAVSGEHQVARPLKLNGTLISSSGKKEVWINGESQIAAGGKQSGNVQLLKANKVRIKQSSSGQTHDMKPGQILDPTTGTISEAYQQGSRQIPQANNLP